MTIKRLSIIAAAFALAVVGCARMAVGFNLMVGHLLLFPGEIVSLFFIGVHGSRKGVLAECVTLIPSFWVWFVIIGFVILAQVKE